MISGSTLMPSRRSVPRSITVGNMFKLVESVRQDMIRGGYCFITEHRSNDSQPRDYLYLNSELPALPENNVSGRKQLESMELTSHHLRAYFQREGFHPKERYSHLYSPLAPKLVVTYEWSMSFRELYGYLNSDNIRRNNWTFIEANSAEGSFGDLTFAFMSAMCCLIWCVRSPSSPPKQIDLCPMWIDILFNDQNAIDIKAELKQAERIYLYARYHLVIATSSVLVRAWCLFEIMTRLKSELQKVSILHNWSKGPTQFAHVANVFDEMQASYESDKELIQNQIMAKFGGKDQFQAAIDKIVKESGDGDMQGMGCACFLTILMFIGYWIAFVVFSPCAVPLFAFGFCALVCSCLKSNEDYDMMFPSPSTTLDSTVVVISVQ